MDYKVGWWRAEILPGVLQSWAQAQVRAKSPAHRPEVSSTQSQSSAPSRRLQHPTDQRAAGTVAEAPSVPGPPDWVSTSPRAGQGRVWGLRKWAEMRGAGNGGVGRRGRQPWGGRWQAGGSWRGARPAEHLGWRGQGGGAGAAGHKGAKDTFSLGRAWRGASLQLELWG